MRKCAKRVKYKKKEPEQNRFLIEEELYKHSDFRKEEAGNDISSNKSKWQQG